MFVAKHLTAPTPELEHLYNAFDRLLEIGETSSPTIDNLKRILILRIVELEASSKSQGPPTRLADTLHRLDLL